MVLHDDVVIYDTPMQSLHNGSELIELAHFLITKYNPLEFNIPPDLEKLHTTRMSKPMIIASDRMEEITLSTKVVDNEFYKQMLFSNFMIDQYAHNETVEVNYETALMLTLHITMSFYDRKLYDIFQEDKPVINQIPALNNKKFAVSSQHRRRYYFKHYFSYFVDNFDELIAEKVLNIGGISPLLIGMGLNPSIKEWIMTNWKRFVDNYKTLRFSELVSLFTLFLNILLYHGNTEFSQTIREHLDILRYCHNMIYDHMTPDPMANRLLRARSLDEKAFWEIHL